MFSGGLLSYKAVYQPPSYPMKAFLLLLTFLIPNYAFSQMAKDSVPDLKAIEKSISDKSSSMYYPILLARYKAGDSTLSIVEKRHLYYGNTFQPNYSAYGHFGYSDSLRNLLNKGELANDDYWRIITFSDSILLDDPYDLRTLKYRTYAARKLGNTAIHDIAYRQIDMVFDAILSTGDGKTAKTALWVTSIDHEYEILHILGFEFGGSQSLVDGPCDYLTVKKNKYDISGLYFNVSIGFGQMENMFKDATKNKSKKKSR